VTQVPGSAMVTALSYDPQGNVYNNNGVVHKFDYGNRLREVVGKGSYLYDAHGRRVRDTVNGVAAHSQYLMSGQLAFSTDSRTGKVREHIYLGDDPVAIRERDAPTNVYTYRYLHTDGLGSAVVETDAAQAVLERSEYEPYGALTNRAEKDDVGYTGHRQDASTGLTYMQQRYYDSQLGRFLSVDPVTAYSNPHGAFNRYWYANDNPYTFKDPDGRASLRMILDAFKVEVSVGLQLEAKAKLTDAVKVGAGLGSMSMGLGVSGAGDGYSFEEGRGPSLGVVVADKVQAGWTPSSNRSEQGRYDVPFTEHTERGGFAVGLKKDVGSISSETQIAPSPTEFSAKVGALIGVELKIDIGQAAYGLFGAKSGEEPAQETEAKQQWRQYKEEVNP